MNRVFAFATILMLTGSILHAQDKNWRKQLETKLEGLYPLTKSNPTDGNVKTPGIQLVFQQPGALSDPVGHSFSIYTTKVVDGRLKGVPNAAGEQYLFKTGDKVYVRNISVRDDNVHFNVMSVDTLERPARGGTPASYRYGAGVQFEFPKGYLATADVNELAKTFSAVLATSAQATASRTIESGQTTAQVEAVLGAPDNVVKLGTKTTYVYKTLKVIFTDGKVTDVQ